MIVELLYTSASQGLKQGSRGFCTVLCTEGLPINLAQRLEALSAYRHLHQPGDAQADNNPVCFSHLRFAVGGRTLSVLSRIAAYGLDYSQRTNKLAHHLVFDGELPSCGPAAVLLQPGLMRMQWDGQCRTLPTSPTIESSVQNPAPCNGWKSLCGDAGWAGMVANAWLNPSGKPTWIIFSEKQSGSLCGLMREAIALLPEKQRWKATFSTYCTNLPPDVDCRVRCVVAGSDEARMSIARGDVIDLTKKLGPARESPATIAARLGKLIGADEPRAAPVVASVSHPNLLNQPGAAAVGAPVAPLQSPTSAQADHVLELDDNALLSPPPAVANKLPPRPLVPAKHLTKPKSPKAHAGTTSPFRFIAGAAVLTLTVITAAGVFMMTRHKSVETVHANSSGKTSDIDSGSALPAADDAAAASKTPPAGSDRPLAELKFPDNSTGSTASAGTTGNATAPPELVCELRRTEFAEDELTTVTIGKVSLKGSAVALANAGLRVLRDGQESKDLEVNKENGQLNWHGPNPKISAVEETFNFKIVATVDGQPLSKTFSIKVTAKDSPNLFFEIDGVIKNSAHTQRDGFVMGAVLEPRFVSGRENDADEIKRERRWIWERRNGEKDFWEAIAAEKSDDGKHIVSLDDIGKSLRVRLVYKTRNNGGETEVVSKHLSTVLPSTAPMPFEAVLSATLNKNLAQVSIIKPSLSEPFGLSYGEANIAITKTNLSLKWDELLTEDDIHKLEGTLKPHRDAINAYRVALGTIKSGLGNGKANGIVQYIHSEFFPPAADDELMRKVFFNVVLRFEKMDTLIEKTVQLGALLQPENGKRLTKDQEDEKKALKKELLGEEKGLLAGPGGPLSLRTERDLQDIVIEFKQLWTEGAQSSWTDLKIKKKAFVVALSSLEAFEYMVASQQKIKVVRRASADNSPVGNSPKTLFEYNLPLLLKIEMPQSILDFLKEPQASKLLAARDYRANVLASELVALALSSSAAAD